MYVVRQLQRLSPVNVWLLAVSISFAMTEIIVSFMEWFLKGGISVDYLLTGAVASFCVAGTVAGFLTLFLQHLKLESTSQRELREQLTKSEERVRDAITSSRSVLWDYDIATGYVYLSDGWSQFLGGEQKPTETTIDELTTLVPEEERQAVKSAIVAALKGNESSSYRIEHRVRRSDDSFIWVLSEGRVTERDANGRALRMLGINRDITQQKIAEDNLRASEEKLRGLYEMSPVGIAMTDMQGHYIEFNEAFRRICGYSEEELKSINSAKLTPTEYADQDMAQFDTLRIRNFYGPYEKELIRKDGGRVPVVLNGVMVHGRGGQPHVWSIVEDISERKQAMDLVISNKRRLDEAQRLAQIGSWDLDLINDTLFWSDETYRIFEVDKSAFVATYEAFLDAIHAEDREMVNAAYTDSVLNRGPYEIAHRLLMPDGRIKWVNERCQTFYDDKGTPYRSMGTVQDITERKRLEQQIQDGRTKLEVLQRRKVAAETAAAFAHELNQPLLAICSYSEASLMLIDSGRPDLAAVRGAIEESKKQALRAGNSIRELLSVLNMGETFTEAFDLNEEIRSALLVAVREHELKFHPDLTLEAGLPRVQGNRIHVQKVLLNLLRNCVEAMQAAGIPATEMRIAVRTTRDEQIAKVTIQDNGPGVLKEDLKRMFEPFFTTKKSGLGVGLAISRSLIEANGGQLWLGPQEGRGATFHLTVPFAQASKFL
jgi:two-component system sensor kinase FixL